MKYIILVQVTDTLNRLHEKFERFAFGKGDFFVLVVKQVPILGVLQNHVDIVLVDESIPQLDDVGVFNLRVQFYLAL